MKSLFFALLLSTHAFAQGAVVFGNRGIRDIDTGFSYDAPVTFPNGERAAGAGFTAGLFLVNPSELLLLNTSRFAEGTAAGFFFPDAVEVPGYPQGASATFLVRVWETPAGSYDNAVSSGYLHGEFVIDTGSPMIHVPHLGGPIGSLPFPWLFGIQPLTLVPEPHVAALIAGGGVLLFTTAASRRGLPSVLRRARKLRPSTCYCPPNRRGELNYDRSHL